MIGNGPFFKRLCFHHVPGRFEGVDDVFSLVDPNIALRVEDHGPDWYWIRNWYAEAANTIAQLRLIWATLKSKWFVSDSTYPSNTRGLRS